MVEKTAFARSFRISLVARCTEPDSADSSLGFFREMANVGKTVSEVIEHVVLVCVDADVSQADMVVLVASQRHLQGTH